jgi:hypothetical protein
MALEVPHELESDPQWWVPTAGAVCLKGGLPGERRLPGLGRALGTKARHGHRRHIPPKRAMIFTEARVLIRALLLASLR